MRASSVEPAACGEPRLASFDEDDDEEVAFLDAEELAQAALETNDYTPHRHRASITQSDYDWAV